MFNVVESLKYEPSASKSTCVLNEGVTLENINSNLMKALSRNRLKRKYQQRNHKKRLKTTP